MIKQKLLDNLICLECFSPIKLDKFAKDEKIICSHCQKEYPIADGRVYMLEKQGRGFNEMSRDVTINKLKVFLKRYPKIFNFFYCVFGGGFVVGKNAKQAIENIGSEKIILNLGSGTKRIREDVINIDFYPFINVDIVADITKLPFKNNSVDAVISEFVLEHVKTPQAVIDEIKRVLKPGGLIYIAIPFVACFHSSPDDYCRWSKEGLRELLSCFREEEINIRCGPTFAMLSVINEWLAIIFSFGSRHLQQILLIIFMIITIPLRFFDYLIYKFPNAENIAHGFYYIGKKK